MKTKITKTIANMPEACETSPLPWQISDRLWMRDAKGIAVCEMEFCSEVNCNYILQAVNERPALVAEADRLRALLEVAKEALKPFAHFETMFRQKPIGKSGDMIYGIHGGTEWEADITHTDMERARQALAALND